MSDAGHEHHSVEEAAAIVATALRRGLGERPRLRRTSAVAWSAFLGACAMMAAGMLLPEDWLTTPVGFERLAFAFLVSWLLSLIPAIAAAMLALPHTEKPASDQKGDGAKR